MSQGAVFPARLHVLLAKIQINLCISLCFTSKDPLDHRLPTNCSTKTDQTLSVLGCNNTSTLVDHFVSSPREREKRDRRDSRGDERGGQGRKRNRKQKK